MQSPEEYWQEFRDLFFDLMKAKSSKMLFDAWSWHGNRTLLYNAVFPDIGKKMKLEFSTERFTVDAVYYAKYKEENVPAIFVESENDASSASQEIGKLCSLSCPLTVLITVEKWAIDQFPSDSQRCTRLQQWNKIIEAHSHSFPVNGLLAIMVGELGTDRNLRFYFKTYLRKEPYTVSEEKYEVIMDLSDDWPG